MGLNDLKMDSDMRTFGTPRFGFGEATQLPASPGTPGAKVAARPGS
jgi:hypothetical protein